MTGRMPGRQRLRLVFNKINKNMAVLLVAVEYMSTGFNCRPGVWAARREWMEVETA